jgi:hypothetical protein
VLALLPAFAGRMASAAIGIAPEHPLPVWVVSRGLSFAMPMIFIGWAGNSLYLSLVPAYLAAALHVSDPLVGAAAFVANQAATVLASIAFGNVAPEKSGPLATVVVVVGLVLLVFGTNAQLWVVIALATMLVGAGAGVASGAAYAIVARVGRGQRARTFSRLLVAAYLGYSIPSLVIGIIAARSTFTDGFITVIAALAIVGASIPFVRARSIAALSAG